MGIDDAGNFARYGIHLFASGRDYFDVLRQTADRKFQVHREVAIRHQDQSQLRLRLETFLSGLHPVVSNT